MDYLYGQNATLINSPPSPRGVTIRLSAIDPNGNPVDLGVVTSDSGGLYKTLWIHKLKAHTQFMPLLMEATLTGVHTQKPH